MVNLGGASVDFKIKGISESQRELQGLIDKLQNLNLSYQKERQLSKEVHENLKKTNERYREVAGSANFVQGAVKSLQTQLDKEASSWKRVTAAIRENKIALEARKRAAGFTLGTSGRVASAARPAALQIPATTTGQAGVPSKLGTTLMDRYLKQLREGAVAAQKMSTKTSMLKRVMAGLSGTTNRVVASFTKMTSSAKIATRSTGQLARQMKKLGMATKEFAKSGDAWWKRFGGVAAGFWIAYRAINAVEIAISNLTSTFASGVKVVDEYRSSVAVIGGMLALLSKGQSGFLERFENFSQVMRGTMMESLRLAPVFRLSMQEIGEGYKELAQFGVIVTKDITDKTLTSIAMIKEIALTTGSSSRQVRQEIQSLFTGTARVTDQFGRFLKRMPELKDALYGIARANVSNADKWKMVIDRMFEYKHAILESIKTIEGQFSVTRNSLEIISGLAQMNSGIYDSWVDTLKEFNKGLFDSKGELNELGTKVYRVFYRIWQVIARIPLFLGEVYDVMKEIFSIAYDVLAPYSEQIALVGKLLAISMAVSVVWGAIGLSVALLLFPFKKIAKVLVTIGFLAWNIVKAVSAISLILSSQIILTLGTVLALGYAFGQSIHRAIGFVMGVGVAFKELWNIIDTVVTLLMGPWDDFMENGKQAATKVGEHFAKMLQAPGDTAQKWADEYSMDAKSAVTNVASEVVDSVTDLVELGYAKLTAKLKEKFPSLSKEFGEILNSEAITEDLTKLFGIKMPKPLGPDTAEASITRWQKAILSMRNEISNVGLGEFARKAKEVELHFSKMEVDLAQAVKKNTKLKAIEEELLGLMKQVREIRLTEIASQIKLRAIANNRLDIEKKFRDLQTRYENFQVNTIQNLTKRRDLQKELIHSAMAELAILQSRPVRDEGAIGNKEEEIRKMREEFSRYSNDVTKFNRGPGAAFADGLKRWARGMEDMAASWEQMGVDVATSMQSSFSDIFFDGMKGELKDAKDYWASFGDAVYRIMADMLAKIVALKISDALFAGSGAAKTGGILAGVGAFASTLFGFGGVSASMQPTGGLNAPMLNPYTGAVHAMATGGIIGEPVFGVGLNSGESYSFAEKGAERVLSNKDSMAYGRGSGNQFQGGDRNFYGITPEDMMRDVEVAMDNAAIRVLEERS